VLSTPKPWPAARASPESFSKMRLNTGFIGNQYTAHDGLGGVSWAYLLL
jgi:hypothetical protein